MCSIYNKIQNPMYVIWKVLMFFSAHLSNTTYQLCSHFPVCNILCCKNTVLFWGSMDFTVLGVLYTWWTAVCFWFCVRVSRMTDIHSFYDNAQFYLSYDSTIFCPSGDEHLPTTQTYTIWLWQIRKFMNIQVYIYVLISALYKYFPISLSRLPRYVL